MGEPVGQRVVGGPLVGLGLGVVLGVLGAHLGAGQGQDPPAGGAVGGQRGEGLAAGLLQLGEGEHRRVGAVGGHVEAVLVVVDRAEDVLVRPHAELGRLLAGRPAEGGRVPFEELVFELVVHCAEEVGVQRQERGDADEEERPGDQREHGGGQPHPQGGAVPPSPDGLDEVGCAQRFCSRRT